MYRLKQTQSLVGGQQTGDEGGVYMPGSRATLQCSGPDLKPSEAVAVCKVDGKGAFWSVREGHFDCELAGKVKRRRHFRSKLSNSRR